MTAAGIKREMQRMGLTPKHKGFFYISERLTELMEKGGKENVKVSRQAERCMRYAINYAWNTENGGIHGLFPNRKTPPNPTEFICAMFWRMDAEVPKKNK